MTLAWVGIGIANAGLIVLNGITISKGFNVLPAILIGVHVVMVLAAANNVGYFGAGWANTAD